MAKETHDRGTSLPAGTGPREYRRRTERNLVIGGFLILFVVGGGLVWYHYGLAAAAASWGCLLGGVSLVGLLFLILKLAEILGGSST